MPNARLISHVLRITLWLAIMCDTYSDVFKLMMAEVMLQWLLEHGYDLEEEYW